MKVSVLIKENPFESPAVPMKGKIQWADRKGLLTSLVSFIKRPPEKWTESLLLLGEYGSGKTHSLAYAKRICEEEKIPVSLLSNPGSSFIDVLIRVVESIRLETVVSSCDHLLKRDRAIVIRQLQNSAAGILTPEAVSTDKLLTYLFPNLDINLAMVLNQLMNERNIESCKTWLLGKREMTSTELARLNLTSAIDSDDYAVKILSNVIQILVARFGKFVLLIDELEDIGNMSRSRAISFAKAMRRFVDENIGGLKLILTFTAGAFNQYLGGTGSFMGKKYPALTERLKPRIELKFLTPEEAEEFISEIVSSVYTGPLEKVITRRAVREIHKQTQGNPRDIIYLCQTLFGEAIDKNKFPIIYHSD